MNDPLDRDLFPNRPDTPDFWRLSEVALGHDASATEGTEGMREVIGSIVDEPSLLYVIEHRLGNAGVINERTPAPIKATLMALYLDAFCLGVDFQNRGGHRDNTN